MYPSIQVFGYLDTRDRYWKSIQVSKYPSIQKTWRSSPQSVHLTSGFEKAMLKLKKSKQPRNLSVWNHKSICGIDKKYKQREQKKKTRRNDKRGDLEESGSNSENINIFDREIFLIIVKGLSPFLPFHDYQKYIPVKCTPRFSGVPPIFYYNFPDDFRCLGVAPLKVLREWVLNYSSSRDEIHNPRTVKCKNWMNTAEHHCRSGTHYWKEWWIKWLVTSHFWIQGQIL